MGTGQSSLYEGARAIRKAERKEDEPRFEYYVMDARPQIEINASKLDKRFKLNEDGYFCERGTGRGAGNRQFKGDNPIKDAREFFDSLTREGCVDTIMPNGLMRTFYDDTRVLLRETTRTPNSPAVNIGNSPSGLIRNQKIHFERRTDG